MTPSERIKIIKEVAIRLSKEEIRFSLVTLRQFGIKTYDPDDFHHLSLFEHISTMIEEATDQTLIDIAQHLGVTFNHAETLISNPIFWEKKCFKLFLSHVSVFKKETTELKEALLYYGISSFVAHDDIEPTKEWQREIELALNTMDGLVAILTSTFHESKWTDQEVGIAMGRGVPIIPVRFGLNPYGFIGKYQGLQGKGKSMYDIARTIVQLLLSNNKSEQKMLSALVYSFIKSNSFYESKQKIELIEKAKYIPGVLVSLLEKSSKENSQVKGSWGVPESINALKNKFTNQN